MPFSFIFRFFGEREVERQSRAHFICAQWSYSVVFQLIDIEVPAARTFERNFKRFQAFDESRGQRPGIRKSQTMVFCDAAKMKRILNSVVKIRCLQRPEIIPNRGKWVIKSKLVTRRMSLMLRCLLNVDKTISKLSVLTRHVDGQWNG